MQYNVEKNEVLEAIDSFLDEQLEKKMEPEQKRLEKAENDAEKYSSIQETITKLRGKYSKSVWLADAANRMAGQLKFGTHISKGVHPDAKGDNINFLGAGVLPEGIVGSQLLASLELDANGNAAALPLAAFFNISVGFSGAKLRDLLQIEHPSIVGAFADDPVISAGYAKKFKEALDNVVSDPSTHERNKQLLWPMSKKAITEDDYVCIVPLYPSSFTHHIYHHINNARYSDENKLARENRNKKTADQYPYVSINDLAATALGGTKPQNVSRLTSKQGGRNYLLPSLPPCFSQEAKFSIAKRQKSIFNNSLRYHCFLGFRELFSSIDHPKNTISVRDQRKQALDMILSEILTVAADIQKKYPPGWSKEYKLDMVQKYWLDPYRIELKGEDEFRDSRLNSNWIHTIQEVFALWITGELKKHYPKKSIQIDDAEFFEWKREMEAVIKASQRENGGVFV